jgi:hypothetical protein
VLLGVKKNDIEAKNLCFLNFLTINISGLAWSGPNEISLEHKKQWRPCRQHGRVVFTDLTAKN